MKSETLWERRQDPFQAASSISDRRLLELAAIARRQLRQGVTGRLPANVYRRTGRPCPRCRTPIRSTAQGDHARRTYHCPECQAA